jgi:hypothetical protein
MRKYEDSDLAALLAAAAAPDPETEADERGLEAVLAAYREAGGAAPDAALGGAATNGAAGDSAAGGGAVGDGAALGNAESGGTAPGSAASASAAPGSVEPQRRPLMSRSLLAKCAVAFFLAAGAGVGAAGAGVLPSSIQRIAHDYLGGVGVPPPSSTAASPSSSAGAGVGPTSTPGSAVTPESSGSAAGSVAPSQSASLSQLIALCNIVVENDKNWHSAVDKTQRDILVAAAGGEPQVLTFCSDLLTNPTPTGSSSGSSSASPSATPSAAATTQHGKAHESKSPKP